MSFICPALSQAESLGVVSVALTVVLPLPITFIPVHFDPKIRNILSIYQGVITALFYQHQYSQASSPFRCSVPLDLEFRKPQERGTPF